MLVYSSVVFYRVNASEEGGLRSLIIKNQYFLPLHQSYTKGQSHVKSHPSISYPKTIFSNYKHTWSILVMWIEVVNAFRIGLVEVGPEHEEDETDGTLQEDSAQRPVVHSKMEGHLYRLHNK
jgi:hypothetical protein